MRIISAVIIIVSCLAYQGKSPSKVIDGKETSNRELKAIAAKQDITNQKRVFVEESGQIMQFARLTRYNCNTVGICAF